MSDQYTSGPWCLFEVGDRPIRLCPGKRDVGGQGGESLLTIVEEDGVAFAAVQRDEDARLIAAAPDLLDVLREIVGDGVHCDVVPHLHRRALAVIAKATGES